MMNRIFLFITLLMPIVFSGCEKTEQMSYYPSGVVKSRIEILEGKPHGTYKHYYPSGELAVTGSNLSGMKSGLEFMYNEDGSLKQEVEWREGMLNGYFKKFSKNGNLLSKTSFIKNRKVGEEDWYHPNGTIITRQILDNLENVIYIIDWDSLGKKKYSRAVPIISVKPDTIRVNQQCLISIKFGYRLTGKIDFDFESLESKHAPQIQFERDSIKNSFVFKLKFTEPGPQNFVITPRHIPLPGDTISVDGYGKEVHLFVKNLDQT